MCLETPEGMSMKKLGKKLVPAVRPNGVWWGVPPLRNEVGRFRGPRETRERDGQCGSAQLHCEVIDEADKGLVGAVRSQHNWRVHPLLAQLGVMPYNCLPAAGHAFTNELTNHIWDIRAALWTQESRRLKAHLRSWRDNDLMPG